MMMMVRMVMIYDDNNDDDFDNNKDVDDNGAGACEHHQGRKLSANFLSLAFFSLGFSFVFFCKKKTAKKVIIHIVLPRCHSITTSVK